MHRIIGKKSNAFTNMKLNIKKANGSTISATGAEHTSLTYGVYTDSHVNVI